MPGAIEEIFGANVLNGKKENVAVATVSAQNTVIGIYFSAHWCPPCRGFTPKLAKFYSTMKTSHPGQLEIVFVSSDSDEKQWTDYFAEMPWLALAYSDRERKENISTKYDVSGIPTLVLLDAKTGDVINSDAYENVDNDPTGSKFPWRA